MCVVAPLNQTNRGKYSVHVIQQYDISEPGIQVRLGFGIYHKMTNNDYGM